MNIDYSLYLVTDAQLCQPRELEQVVAAAIEGGVTLVQLREKQASTQDMLAIGKRIKSVTDDYKIPLLINDRIDIALALQASGVHLGQSDMPYPLARSLFGPDKIIGLSISSLAELEQITAKDIDYLGVGPVFPTATKADAKPAMGLELLRQIRQQTSYKLVAIGGINTTNALAVLQTAVEGIAVVSAILGAADPKQAAQQLAKVNRHEALL